MKFRFSAIISFAAVLLFFTTEIFACACCAERGHYSISTSKPDQYITAELKKINFASANLYTDASFPENIKGIKPVSENFSIKGNLNNWMFSFEDDKSNKGSLNLSKPVSMVSYMVDQNPGDESNEVTLYKELRFKYKVKNAAGIFGSGFDGTTEYFLVLQGSGNVCTFAEDFKHYRLEITGKKANYMFYGKVNAGNTNETADFKLGTLKGDYSGCSCSIQTLAEAAKSGKWKTINFYSDLGDNEEIGYFNINGKDTALTRVQAGKRPDVEKVGSRYADVYETDGMKIKVDYIVSKLPCEECEGTDYDVFLTITKGNQTTTQKALGSCGC